MNNKRLSVIPSNEITNKRRFYEDLNSDGQPAIKEYLVNLDQPNQSTSNKQHHYLNQIRRSTPTNSSSTLMTVPVGKDQISSKYLVSSLFDDIKDLKKEFGIFNHYEQNQYNWFGKVKAVCKNRYQNPDDIIQFFHLFLDKMYQDWCMKLNAENLEELESMFYDEIFRSKNEQESDVHLKGQAYLDKLNQIYKNDSAILKEISDYPLSSFFKYKFFSVRKLYKTISDKELMRMILFMIDDKDTKIKLEKFLNTSVKNVYDTLKLIDQMKSNQK